MLKSRPSKISFHSLKISYEISPPLISSTNFDNSQYEQQVMKHFPTPNCVLLAQAERKQKLDFLLFFAKSLAFQSSELALFLISGIFSNSSLICYRFIINLLKACTTTFNSRSHLYLFPTLQLTYIESLRNQSYYIEAVKLE